MIYQVVSVRDAVHQEYQGLNLEMSEASAVRNFSSSVMSSNAKQEGLLYSHAKDFSLWKLAEFDSESGEIIMVQPVRLIEGGEIHA